MTITDAAFDGDATVVFCDLLENGARQCPGCGNGGIYRDTVIRNVTDVQVAFAAGAGARSALSLHQQRVLTGSVSPRAHPAGVIGLVDHPAVCPLHFAPADRPHDRGGPRPRTRVVVGHRQRHLD